MSTLPAVETTPRGVTTNRVPDGPRWDPVAQRARTRLWLRMLVAFAVSVWVFILGWTLYVAPIVKLDVRPLEVGVDLFVAFAPILVVSLAIEQLLETVFSIIEARWRTLVAYVGYGLHWLHNAETELQEARRLLSEVSNEARRIQIDFPTAAWLSEIREQRKSGSAEAASARSPLVEPLLKVPEDRLTELRQTVTRLFNEDELRTLCFDLGVDYDNVGGETKESKVRELIAYQYRRGQLRRLINTCAQYRADVRWRNLSEQSPNDQAEMMSFEGLFADVLDKAQEQSNLINTMITMAKKRVSDAERELESVIAAPGYRRAKAVACTLTGLQLGVLLATLIQVQLFALLGIAVVPARIDVLMAGLTIGALTRPIHLIVQSLQNLVSRTSSRANPSSGRV